MAKKQSYQEILARLRDAVRRKRPELWENQIWMLHHDNAPAHASLLIRSYLAKHQTSVVLQPPYSADLAPANLFLFPKLKSTLKDVVSKPERRFRKMRQKNCAPSQSAFQEAFQQWKKLWESYIASRGDYFEGNSA